MANNDGTANLDIYYRPGSEISNNRSFTVTDADGVAVNLAGVELEMQVKYKPEDPLTRAVIIFKTTDSTLTISGASSNIITLHGAYQIDTYHYYHDLLRKDIPEYIWAGQFIASNNVTRN